jgi:MYND finger
VFFESKDDADHPQVQMFLTMMGMESKHIQVIDPAMNAMLEANMNAVGYSMEKTAFSKRKFPHINDMCKGIFCRNCRKTGPQLMKCVCGEAHYCNRECQKAVWKQHKNIHKKAIEKRTNGQGRLKQQPSATQLTMENR